MIQPLEYDAAWRSGAYPELPHGIPNGWASSSQSHEQDAPDTGEVDRALHTGATVKRTFLDGQELPGPGVTAFDHDYNQ